MKSSIDWNEKGIAKSILEAEKEVRLTGNDVGWAKIETFIPRDDNHHHWMSFSALLTVIYNRDHEKQRFSIFRVVIYDFIAPKDSITDPYTQYKIGHIGGGGRLGPYLFVLIGQFQPVADYAENFRYLL